MKPNQTLPRNWLIRQKWEHVLFLSWFVDPAQIQHLIPFELDTWNGKAVISIVPFKMCQIRLRGLPEIPFASELAELNLRTYVKHGNQSGIHFVTLDTDSRLGQWVANTVFKLPYRYAEIDSRFPSAESKEYRFASKRREYEWEMTATPGSPISHKSGLDRWITDRYHLFQHRQDQVLKGTVHHEDWKLSTVQLNEISGAFGQLIGLNLGHPPDHLAYAREIDVTFPPFVRISRGSAPDNT
jgi:uncharacterized protein YqjF (DUF2071 family)